MGSRNWLICPVWVSSPRIVNPSAAGIKHPLSAHKRSFVGSRSCQRLLCIIFHNINFRTAHLHSIPFIPLLVATIHHRHRIAPTPVSVCLVVFINQDEWKEEKGKISLCAAGRFSSERADEKKSHGNKLIFLPLSAGMDRESKVHLHKSTVFSDHETSLFFILSNNNWFHSLSPFWYRASRERKGCERLKVIRDMQIDGFTHNDAASGRTRRRTISGRSSFHSVMQIKFIVSHGRMLLNLLAEIFSLRRAFEFLSTSWRRRAIVIEFEIRQARKRWKRVPRRKIGSELEWKFFLLLKDVNLLWSDVRQL